MCIEARCVILYDESAGAAWRTGNGVRIILTRWTAVGNEAASSHFILQTRISVAGEEEEVAATYWSDANSNADMVRIAILYFDRACSKHSDPEIKKLGQDRISLSQFNLEDPF